MTNDTSFRPASLGFVRVAVVSPELRVADVAFNTDKITEAMAAAAGTGARLALVPRVVHHGLLVRRPVLPAPAARTGACGAGNPGRGCRQSRHRRRRRPAAGSRWQALQRGQPARGRQGAWVCAEELSPEHGRVLRGALVHAGGPLRGAAVRVGAIEVPFGPDLLFAALNLPGLVVGIEICEDLWAVSPPSGDLAQAGATVLLNGSASNELLGKVEYRRDLVRQQSARSLAAYLYAGAGPGESTTDLVWAGHSMIAENGAILAETERFKFETQMVVADVDVQRLLGERLRSNTYSAAQPVREYRKVAFALPGAERVDAGLPLIRPLLSRMPFVPADPERRAEHCREIFNIQSIGLAKRLRHTGSKQVTIGLSGGLDSTLALLVTVRAFDIAGLPREGIQAVTMPGFRHDRPDAGQR